MKKKILFDEQIFQRQNFGGISRYFAELITGINQTPGYKALPRKFCSHNIYLQNYGLNISLRYKLGVGKFVQKMKYYRLCNRLKRGRFSVFHPTYYDSWFLKYLPEGKPLVVTVHDMIHENHFDNIFQYLSEETKHKMLLIPRADHIIAVSHYTKTQVVKHFPGINPGKISVIYHGSNLRAQPGTALPPGVNGGYLLFVGIKKFYKNFFWLVKSLQDYLKKNSLVLLCAGGFGFDAFEKRFLAGLGLEQNVIAVPFQSDRELAALYQHALCFIFPSSEEGFGMPILEAFACSCPVILSKSSAFPEIAGDAALYFEPGDSAQLISQIELVRQNEQLKQSLISKGLERLKFFNWEKTVAGHIAVYDSLLT